MDQLKEQEYMSAGRKIALWCASPAALVFLVIIISKLLDVFLEQQERQQQNLVTGLVYFGVLMPVLLGTLYLSATSLGRLAGKLIYRRMQGLAGAAFVGICWALSCLLSVAVIWIVYNVTVAAMFNFMTVGAALIASSIVGIAVLLFGSVPAILLGVVYGILVRREVANRLAAKPDNSFNRARN